MKLTGIEYSILFKETVIVLCMILIGLHIQGQVNAQTSAASVAVRQAAKANDSLVSQGEFNWEYGYINTYTGGGTFYGWHQNPFFSSGKVRGVSSSLSKYKQLRSQIKEFPYCGEICKD